MKTSDDSFLDASDQEALLGVETPPIEATGRQRASIFREQIGKWLIVGTALILGVGLGFLVAASLLATSDNDWVKRTTYTTPILEDVKIQYDTVAYNGSFMQEDMYRRVASPEVDAAWEKLGVNYRSVKIPVERAKEAGLRPEHVQINDRYGGGFPANVEGLHHLHCLNLLRQALYYNFEYYHAKGDGAFKNDDHILQLHVSHCLDILRQQLMCTVDVGVFGQVWYRSSPDAIPSPFVDFNTNHKCRNFDDIRHWAESRQLPLDPPDDFLQPPGSETRILDGVP